MDTLFGGSRNACQDFTRQSKCATRFHKSHFTRKFTGKMLQTKTAPQTLCEPAQSKRMSRFHKSHFIRKFTGKMPQPRVSTLIKHRPLHLPLEPLSVDTLFGENCPMPWFKNVSLWKAARDHCLWHPTTGPFHPHSPWIFNS